MPCYTNQHSHIRRLFITLFNKYFQIFLLLTEQREAAGSMLAKESATSTDVALGTVKATLATAGS